jgi:hypothetical protein
MLHTIQAQARGTPAPAQGPSGAEISQQIRQSIIDAQIAARDAARAAQEAGRAAGGSNFPVIAPVPPVPPVPPGGFTIQPNDFGGGGLPPGVADISIAFFLMCAVIIIGWPLARAFGKRIERRAEAATLNPALSDQLQRIEQAVDAMSIEIERISESQRFMARLQNSQTPERVGLPADRS